MVQDKITVPGRPTNLLIEGHIALAVGSGGSCSDFFLSFLSPALRDG